MHADFNWHKKLKLYRRLNLLIYFNTGWQETWLGDLELGLKEKNKLNIYSKISPKFNRTVLFTTTEKSFHGHPEKLNVPDGISRNSMALYYYVSTKPKGTSLIKRTSTKYNLETKQNVKSLFLKLVRKIKCLIISSEIFR